MTYVVRCLQSEPPYEREAKDLDHAYQLLDHFDRSYCDLPHDIVTRELVDGELRTVELRRAS